MQYPRLAFSIILIMGLVLTACASPTLTPAPTATPQPTATTLPNGWQEYSSQIGNYSVLLPGVPNETKDPIVGGDYVYTANISPAAGVLYFVSWLDYPVNVAGIKLDAFLKQTVDLLVGHYNGVIISTQDVGLGGYVGKEVRMEAPNYGKVKLRIYQIGLRQYQLFATYNDTQPALDDAARFLDSFKLLAMPPMATSNNDNVILPPLLNFSGTGDQTTAKFGLNYGVARLKMAHSGSKFAVTLLNEAGEKVDFPASSSSKYAGSAYVKVPVAGKYSLQVEADGAWQIEVRDIYLILQEDEPNTGPYKGKGDAAILMKIPKKGLTTFKMTHNGKGQFVVTVPTSRNGSLIFTLANHVGAFSGQKVEETDNGIYLLSVRADGDWTVELV